MSSFTVLSAELLARIHMPISFHFIDWFVVVGLNKKSL